MQTNMLQIHISVLANAFPCAIQMNSIYSENTFPISLSFISHSFSLATFIYCTFNPYALLLFPLLEYTLTWVEILDFL